MTAEVIGVGALRGKAATCNHKQRRCYQDRYEEPAILQVYPFAKKLLFFDRQML